MLNDTGNEIAAPSGSPERLLAKGDEARPVIRALAPNGAYKQKTDHPALPLTTDEIVQTAIEALREGAALLHLHIRDKNGRHSLSADIYQRTICAIREQTGDSLIIQITSEAAGQFSPRQQIASIQAVNPECVSIALRELIPDSASLPAAQELFHWCAAHQCRPQFILYSEADLLSYLQYRKQNIIPSEPHSVLFVLGRYFQHRGSTTKDLDPFLKHRAQLDVPWMVCAFGASEQRCLLDAARQGGHIRLGFENNLLNARGQVANSNIGQLQAITRAAKDSGMNLATVQEARTMLGIR